MKKVFVINGGQHFAHSGGKFNHTIVAWDKQFFTAENGFELKATDEDGNVSVVTLVHPKEQTKNNESIEENFKINLAKTRAWN